MKIMLNKFRIQITMLEYNTITTTIPPCSHIILIQPKSKQTAGARLKLYLVITMFLAVITRLPRDETNTKTECERNDLTTDLKWFAESSISRLTENSMENFINNLIDRYIWSNNSLVYLLLFVFYSEVNSFGFWTVGQINDSSDSQRKESADC